MDADHLVKTSFCPQRGQLCVACKVINEGAIFSFSKVEKSTKTTKSLAASFITYSNRFLLLAFHLLSVSRNN